MMFCYFREEYIEYINGCCLVKVCKLFIRYVIIMDKCMGCIVCVIFCLVNVISGERFKFYFID